MPSLVSPHSPRFLFQFPLIHPSSVYCLGATTYRGVLQKRIASSPFRRTSQWGKKTIAPHNPDEFNWMNLRKWELFFVKKTTVGLMCLYNYICTVPNSMGKRQCIRRITSSDIPRMLYGYVRPFLLGGFESWEFYYGIFLWVRPLEDFLFCSKFDFPTVKYT